MDDETLTECFYEAMTCGRYDDVAVQLLRGEVGESDLSPSERATALAALDKLERAPGDGDAIESLYGVLKKRPEFIRRMAEKLRIALSPDDDGR